VRWTTPAPLLLALACAPTAEEPQRGAPGTPAQAPTFSREAFATPPSSAAAAAASVPSTPDPRALAEILAAAPHLPPAGDPRAPDARIGSDTGVHVDAGAADASATPAKGPRVHVGKLTIEPGMSTPAIERAARAQLYWPMVQRCRDAGGAILPPEVVHLTFHLDRDGYVIPASILAVAKDAAFADAARCMARELAAAAFRAPPGARGLPEDVSMDVPSVD
jgi:hypothetical protein